jgi:phage-related protein
MDDHAQYLRDMTPDERRGFDYALDCVETWATQLQTHAVAMPTIEAPATLNAQMENSAQLARAMASALRAGFPAPPPPMTAGH